MVEVSRRVKGIEESKIGESLKVLEQEPSIISLGAGEPDFSTPQRIIEATKKFLEKGYTHYAPLEGKVELREALADKLKKENKIDVSPEEVLVTCGSKEAILLTILSLIDPGEKVIIPDPGYLAFRPIVLVANGVPISLHLRQEDGFEINIDELKKLIDPKVKLLIINTPSNPTGAVFKKKTLEEIADVVVENELMVLSDEVYERLVYEGKHISIGSLNGMKDYVITTQSFSKSYAMCGFRIGYVTGPLKLVEEMKKLKICTTISAPTASQMAAIEALKCEKDVEKMRKEYDRRRKLLIKRLSDFEKMEFVKPKGAFYFFPNISAYGMSSEEFSEFLLEKVKVLVLPGNEFGKYGEGFIRISYATAYEKIEEAMDRMEKVLS